MRKDLNKLLCERERWASDNKFGNYRHMKEFTHSQGEELEDLPLREGMRKRYKVRGNWKTFGENLNPLLGFIRKSVGKRWDESYSELCSVFDMSSVINQHIELHLFQFVERKVVVENGELFYYGRWGGRKERILDWNGPWYYVHPVTGILMENTERTSYKKYLQRREHAEKVEEAKTRRVISDTLELRRRSDGDVWFLCEIRPIDQAEYKTNRLQLDGSFAQQTFYQQSFDVWDREFVTYGFETRTAGRFRKGVRHGTNFVSSVRTASHKDLKKYGII